MIRKVLLGVCLAAHADFYPGKILTAKLCDYGFDTVVPTGRAVRTNAQPSRRQGNIIKQNDDPLGRYMKIGTQLQNTSAGQIHISLWL